MHQNTVRFATLLLVTITSLSVHAGTSTTSLPDLVVTSVTYQPAKPTLAEYVYATITVKNQGQAQAVFRVDQSIVGVKPFGGTVQATEDFVLPVGNARTYKLCVVDPRNGSRTAGTHNLEYTANPDSAVAESNVGNNKAVFPLTLTGTTTDNAPPTTDLSLESIAIQPAQGTTATAYTFVATVKNVGNTKAKLESILYELPNQQRFGLNNPTPKLPLWLDPGQSVTVRGGPWQGGTKDPTKLPAGLLTVWFWAQAPDLSEKFTDNNRRAAQVEVVDAAIGSVGLPSLYLKDFGSIPSKTAPFGETVKIFGSVTNHGDGGALILQNTALLNVAEAGKVLASGTWSATQDYAIPADNGSSQFPVWMELKNLAPGPHRLTVTIDPGKLIKEKDETHHQGIIEIMIVGPDGGVTAALAPGQTPTLSDPIMVEATVKNFGPMKASFPKGSHFLYYGAKGFTTHKLILTEPVELAAGQEHRTTLKVPAFAKQVGDYTLDIWLDPVNRLGDSNQGNNHALIPVHIVAKRIDPASVKTADKPATKSAKPDAVKKASAPPKTQLPTPTAPRP